METAGDMASEIGAGDDHVGTFRAYEGFAPDDMPILPDQFPPSYSQTPEQALMWAILENGIDEFAKHRKGNTRRAKRLAAEDREWFRDTDDTYLFSYRTICLFLGLEPDRLCRAILAGATLRPVGARNRHCVMTGKMRVSLS